MKKLLIKNISNKAYYSLLTLIALVVVILLNVIVSYLDFRVDFTADKRYSLTRSTVDFLNDDSKLKDRILFKIYLDGDLPAEVKRLRTAIKDKLNEFKYYAGKRIEFEFIDPNMIGEPADQKALKELLFDRGRGIRPAQITYKVKGTSKMLEIFPGATVEYRGNTVDYIRFMEGGQYRLDYQLEQVIQRAINDLEYKFMRSLDKATRSKKQTLAFLHGHGELAIPQTQGARKSIEDSYIIQDVMINESISALDKIDGLIIADPHTSFSDKEKFVLDQYLLSGGNIMLFYNPLFVDNDTIRKRGMVHSVRRRTGLEKLIYDYGIKINEDLVVDANYDPFVMPNIPKGFINWYYYVRAQGTNHPVSSMVDPVKLPYASTLQFVQNSGNIRPAVILTSSANSKSMGNAPLLSIAIEQTYGENPEFTDDPTNPDNRIMLGAIVEGEFISAFKNRLVKDYAENPDARFLEESNSPGKLMVVSNGTFFKNTYYDSVFRPEEGTYRYLPRYPKGREIDELLAGTPINGNFDFFENCVDYMMGESTLLAIRSRTIDLHPTDKLKIEKHSSYYKFINIFIPILSIIGLAVVVFIRRRLKYSRRR
jgi:gliding-associated putative ABC transporter substrate-binding component GldG